MPTSRNPVAHEIPTSSFDRTRDYDFDFNPQWPSPSNQDGTRPRQTFPTGTLAGAYRATSYASMTSEDAPLGTTSSPRHTRHDARSLSNASNPPQELLNVYKRIEEDGTLAEYVSVDAWDTQAEPRPVSRLGGRPSSSAREERTFGLGLQDRFTSPEGSLLGTSIGANSPRRRTSDHTRDEQRLKRVTGGQSPVFSKAKVGARAALTADNLQRREDEIEHEHVSDAGSEERRLSLNLPSTWGSRAARRQDWLRNVSGNSYETKEEQATTGDTAEPHGRIEQETAPRPVISSGRSFERRSGPIQSALESSTVPSIQAVENPTDDQKAGLNEKVPSDDGAPIPNTPIVVYKNSTFARPSPSKRDSQDLLRKLSRTESPKLDQMKTPDPPKLFERKIYDKTPRVTGAWIDTPMAERVSDPPVNAQIDLNKHDPAPWWNKAPAPRIESSMNAPPVFEPEEVKPDASTVTETAPEPQPTQNSRPPLSRPKLPRSALETVMEDVTSGKDTLYLTDDTIESLQAIIEDPTELKSEEEDEEAYEKEVLKKLSHAEPKSQGGSVDFDRLGDKMASLAKNISEVKRGLTSLEEIVIQDTNAKSQSKAPTKETVEPPHLHTGEACKACNVQSDGRLYAAIPLPRLWTRNLATDRLQVTKLGWAILVSLAWYVIECMMWDQYGQSNITDSCDGYCVPADAPDFPWVTVTMAWRWSHLSAIFAPIISVGVVGFRLVAQLLGLSDGFVDEPPSLGNLVGEIRVNGTSVSFPWLSSLSGNSAIPPPQAPPQQQQKPQEPPQQPPQPAWTPRFEVTKEAPVRWAADQPSMDDDEYL